MDDTVDDKENVVWGGTFQLCWNELIDNFAKQDIVFVEDKNITQNLNKRSFDKDQISENDVYIFAGKNTFENKDKIERSIKEKFNENSEILDNFEWFENEKDAMDFCYSMLYKNIEFEKKFDLFKNMPFYQGNTEKNVDYFGVDKNSKDFQKDQIKILYYNSGEDFAVKIYSKTDDEIIVCSNPKGETLSEIYDNINKTAETNGSVFFGEEDSFKMPIISLKAEREYKELENKFFLYKDGSKNYINAAYQMIEFDLDQKGAKLKDESGIAVSNTAMPASKPKNMICNKRFVVFLKEKDKKPYFGLLVNNTSVLKER